MHVVERNWSGNQRFSSPVRHPETIDELRELVARASRVRPIGTRHSFNDIADSDEVIVAVDALPQGVDPVPDEDVVWAAAGMRYGDLAARLNEQGLALHNLASLPHISLAGTVATGTHGSGRRNGSLATAVAGLELVTAEGELRVLRRGDEGFDGAVVSLGALGVVTRVALDTQPAFTAAQHVFLDLPFDTVADNLLEILGLGYSTSLFTRWQGEDVDQLWVKTRGAEAPTETFGGRPADVAMHPIAGVDASHTTQQLGVEGPWLDRLPHFRLDFTPSAGEELQSEFFVDAADAGAAMRALRTIADRIAPVLLVCEIRSIAADELWLSGAYGRDTVAFHFTWQLDEAGVLPVVAEIERTLAAFSARPHWGKVFTATADTLAPLYPRASDFLALREEMDPRGVFVNDYLRRVLLG